MFNQPSENVALPENVQRAVEQSRNLVTINEAEAKRLKELALSSQYTVDELHKQKVELEAQIESILTRKTKLLKEEESVVKSLEEKKTCIEELSQETNFLMGKIEKAKYLLKTIEGEVEARHSEIIAIDFANSSLKESLTSREKAVEEKEARIKELAL